MFKFFKRLFKVPADTFEVLPNTLREGKPQLLQKVVVKPSPKNVISDDLVSKLQYRQAMAKTPLSKKVALLKGYPW